MTNENLERLIKVLDGTQFEIENRADGYVWVSLKDPWEGVEFCKSKCSDSIYLVSDLKDLDLKQGYIPSTEEAYVNQLKDKAFELYGEIKYGDRFEDWEGNDFEIYKTVFTYSKIDNRLYLDSWIIHEEGKWAKKLPKRIEVNLVHANVYSRLFYFRYSNETTEKMINIGSPKIGEFLANQLEKLLNDEVD
jgi:hypothetical protein